MKKLIVALVFLGACHSAQTTTTTAAPASTGSATGLSGNQTGAVDPAGAIRGFLTAAKAQDLQAMSAIWGTAEGPARDHMDRAYLEKTELIMVCYLKHDRYDIVGDAPNPGGTRAAVVNLTLGNLTRSTTFELVQGPASRWYVQSFDMQKLQEFCAKRG